MTAGYGGGKGRYNGRSQGQFNDHQRPRAPPSTPTAIAAMKDMCQSQRKTRLHVCAYGESHPTYECKTAFN